jgi:hypothetical protein
MDSKDETKNTTRGAPQISGRAFPSLDLFPPGRLAIANERRQRWTSGRAADEPLTRLGTALPVLSMRRRALAPTLANGPSQQLNNSHFCDNL